MINSYVIQSLWKSQPVRVRVRVRGADWNDAVGSKDVLLLPSSHGSTTTWSISAFHYPVATGSLTHKGWKIFENLKNTAVLILPLDWETATADLMHKNGERPDLGGSMDRRKSGLLFNSPTFGPHPRPELGVGEGPTLLLATHRQALPPQVPRLGPLVDSRPRYRFVAFDLRGLAVFRREDVCRSYRNWR